MKNFIQNALGAKKLSLFVLGLLMSIAGIQRANAANEIYAALSGSTMTLYYDDQKASRPDVLDKWRPATGAYYVPEETRNSITKVVINPSMKDARPASTHSWFWCLTNLTTIDGLANFNTSEVTEMREMFEGCSSLTSLDLTGFNTAKVQNMNYMFAHCYALTSLDVSKFNTGNVSKMEGMFYGCISLTSLDVSNFNTANVERMYNMFYYCTSLTSLDVSNFNTANVTTMYGMFYGCSSLTTIYCDEDWSTGSATSDDMFYGCTALEGGKGTKYDADKIDKTYARLDGMGDKPGYFTAKGTVKKEIYATLSEFTMTLYYDDQKASRPDVLDKWSPAGGTYYLSEETCNSITKVIINPSMEDARPTRTRRWFSGMENLTTIDGMANLNTSEVTDMSIMFYGCKKLKSLDLTGFNTAKVQDMNYMFAYCYALTSLDVSKFNTDNVTNMLYMFDYCISLTSLDVSNFNTANVTTMYGMFYGCSSLTTINCEDDWSTGSATSDGMFYGCTSLEGGNGTKYDAGKTDKTYARLDGLDGKPGYFSAKGVVRKTIYAALSGSTMTLYYDDQKASRSGVLDKWSPGQGTSYVPKETCNSITKAVIDPSMEDARPASTDSWFWRLANLTIIEGLANLNTSEVTDMSHMFRECKKLTSLDLSNFNIPKVTKMEYMFYYCSSLISLDLSNFNTSNVTKMEYMFYGCTSLTSLDLSNFNTSNVTSTVAMFYGCTSLTTIYCDEDWSTGSATSDNMFYGCTSLEGGKGTKYDADKIDATYARPDGMGGKPGYFKELGPKEIYAALNGSTMTIYFDNKKTIRPGVLDKWTPGMGVDMDDATCYSITKAVIDPSIAAALPTKTNFWFWNLANLTAIDGLAYLNTSEVTNMSGMFMYCALLTEVDVSTFNTGKVTNMRSMFSSCPSLTELDLTGFNTGKVSDMETMFYGCSSLQTIYCDETWTPSSSDNMFYGCTSLVGGYGTKYDADKTDAIYARPDGLGGQLGYFTASLTPEEKKEIDAVIDLINGIGTVTYTPECKAQIDAARAAYDALTDVQKAFISPQTLSTLIAAEQTYAELKQKAEADLAAAGIVMAKIDAIGTVAYTEASKALIDAARTAYDALTAAQKVLVTNYGVLTAAEKAYADLKAKAEADQAAANAVIVKIDAIGTVTLSSEAAILDARSAYDALTADQKALVTNLPTLVAAEAALDQLKKQAAADQAAANIVISKISAIGTVEYTTESKARIDAAREAYDGLTAAQKVLVTNYGVLTAAEKAYADLKAKAEADQAAANAVIVKIDAIGDVTLASEPAIVAARSAYDALTAAQKLLVTNLSTLTAAEAKLEILKKQAESDEAAAKAVTDLINAIGTVTYTSESKARIDAAREAYDALTATQKALVTNLSTLTAAEQAYADLKAKAEADQAAANAVIAKIDAIGTVTLESEAAITAARTAYDALTAAQQALVTNFGTLLSAEATLELLKHQAETDKAAADAVIAKINAIGTVTLESEAAILDARSAYDALTAAQKALVTNLSTLTAAEKKLAELKANAEAVENAKLQLKNIVSQANELKAVALIYAPSAVSDLDAVINDAQSMIDDPNATVDQINAEAATLTGDLHTIAVSLLDQAKEQLKQSIIALFLPGDYPSWYASVITPALNQVDAVAWDFNKTVNENIVFFQTTGTQIYNDTKSALEALRAGDTRTIVTACAFTGFENAVRTDMTWDISALNDLINTLNTSVASEPYRLDAEMSSLGKWDPVNEELIILDPTEAQTLTAGDYRFISAVRIDGEEANLYRLPKATEEVLSVTVDGAGWTIDLSGIVIDVAYCYTVVKSPMFTVSNGEDVELVNEDRIKTQKIYHNGHFYILRGEHIFDIRGTMVK